MQPWHEPAAVIAVKLARSMDRKDLPPAELMRLSASLRSTLDALPLAAVSVVPPADVPEGDSDADEPDEIDRELADIVGSGPSLGDPTHP